MATSEPTKCGPCVTCGHELEQHAYPHFYGDRIFNGPHHCKVRGCSCVFYRRPPPPKFVMSDLDFEQFTRDLEADEEPNDKLKTLFVD